jgi:hypothetical protein
MYVETTGSGVIFRKQIRRVELDAPLLAQVELNAVVAAERDVGGATRGVHPTHLLPDLHVGLLTCAAIETAD